MSNEIKNAIDTGLGGLCVTEGDVAALMRRVRADGPRQREKNASTAFNWRLALAMAVVMLVLVAAVGLRLASTGVPDQRPLTQPEANATQVPAGFVPVTDKEPVISIDANRAIALAEAYVLTHYGQEQLRDATLYEITCEYSMQETERGRSWNNFYAVRFAALTIEGTEYALRVSAEDGSILSCDVQRGAQPGHTAHEVLAGYARHYGADRRTWTQEQLRAYCLSLRMADGSSLRWDDYLYLLSSYPDVAEDAMDRETVIAAVMDDIDTLIWEYDREMGTQDYWQSREQVGDARARYISAYPNPVWKVAVDQRVVNADGYETTRTLLFEVDSVTGQVKHTEAVEAIVAFGYENFTRATIDALKATTTSGDGHPGQTDEERSATAAAYVASRWGETRNIADPALFTLTENQGEPASMQCPLQLCYTSTGEGDVTQYVLYIDDYGEVLAANRSVTPAGAGTPFTPTAPALDWDIETLQVWQDRARYSAQADDPAVQVFLGTTWRDAYYNGEMYSAARQAAFAKLGVRACTNFRAVQIDAQPAPVWKLAFFSDQGEFLVEVDSETNEVLHILRVDGIYQNWYLPFVLTADLRAAGVAIPEDAAPAYPADKPHDTAEGMRVDHLYVRFKRVFGPDMILWTQEQLRTFQQMAVLSSDFDYDLGVICLRNTVYPDVPANAISREEAAARAIDAIGNGTEGWEMRGAVLIGTKDGSLSHGTPVWKLCLRAPGGSFWYAEVNCMTGKVCRLHQDADGAGSPGASYDYGTPQNLWFRDIVLEETIEDCDVIWDCRGNG